uniref:Uncharacterized protein n=1 Tax=Cacopsylla melanoneura TaxID=428564 RepID=A0A8D8WZN5_9HEMI
MVLRKVGELIIYIFIIYTSSVSFFCVSLLRFSTRSSVLRRPSAFRWGRVRPALTKCVLRCPRASHSDRLRPAAIKCVLLYPEASHCDQVCPVVIVCECL